VLAAIALATLATTQAASAGSISLVGGVPTFTAGFAETNDVEVWGDPTGIWLKDSGAPLTASGGCTQGLDPATAFCPVAVDGHVSVDLGDVADTFARLGGGPSPPTSVSFAITAGAGDDSVDLTGIGNASSVDGGNGADAIIGGSAGDNLNGGADDDEVDSGGGAPVFPEDSVSGGTGHDVLRLHPLRGGVHGGDGFDTVDFSFQNADYYVELGAFSGPVGFDHFQFVGADVEAIWTGSGDDTLVGDDNHNAFWGNSGEDVMVGNGGDDEFDADDGERDELYCGPGTDDGVGDDKDAVGGDCELVDVGDVFPPANDDFADALSLDGLTAPIDANNVHATEELDEPAHADGPGGASVWFTWTPSFTGTGIVRTAGSNFDTLLGIYSGDTVDDLTTLAGNDDAGVDDRTSRVCFPAVSGTPVAIAADGFGSGLAWPGGLGDVVLDWGQYTSSDPCAIRPPTVGGSATVGGTLTSTQGLWAGSPSSFTYQWIACLDEVSCASIPGAIGATYSPVEDDVGLRLGVRVVAHHPSDESKSAYGYSSLSAVVPAPPPPPGGGGGGGGGGGPTDLKVTGSVSPSQAGVGASHVWRFRVENAGSGIAFGVHLDLELSANVAFGFAQVTRGSGCTPVGERRYRCNLDLLGRSGDPSSVAELAFGTNVTAVGEVSIAATSGHNDPDPTPGDNAITLRANIATAPPPSSPPTAPPTGVTRNGTQRGDSLRGTKYADLLRGLGGPDKLYGLGGADRLVGGAGADLLVGGAGRDLLEGGGGNDRILARDGARDVVRCGLGRDVVEVDRLDRIARDCEVVRRR